ncbi:hypothetical protein MDA_GLEAN10013185 [Myotis davidii]|uniref:Uncharacterized protein n=1 Tax=Myotis davidii TaxID=225400 RepID=L5M5T2_MYODS|nr:hypothetical protein MDA_GLEAN10013185 [Myotis davidii]
MILSTCEYDGFVAGLQACFVLGTVLVLEHRKGADLQTPLSLLSEAHWPASSVRFLPTEGQRAQLGTVPATPAGLVAERSSAS